MEPDIASRILHLRRLCADGPLAEKRRIPYGEAAEALGAVGLAPVTPAEVERMVKEDVRERWQLHLPQVFRPAWGASKSEAHFSLVEGILRERGEERQLGLRPIGDQDLLLFVRSLDFVVFQRFSVLLLDRLGWMIVEYGNGYGHGADAVTLRLTQAGVQKVVVEAKSGQSRPGVGRDQIRKYMRKHGAGHGLVMAPEVRRVPLANDVETWGGMDLVQRVREAGWGESPTGAVEFWLQRDLHCYFTSR